MTDWNGRMRCGMAAMVAVFLGSCVATGADLESSRPLNAAVSSGMERLLTPEYQNLVIGRRIGVLAHHASRDRNGTHVVDALSHLPGVQLKMIFAPEHGYRSVDDTLEPDSTDPETGLPVYSLYGPRTAPAPAMLAQLDAIVIDLQDVGVRFYTYAATVVHVLQACRAAGKPVILLDRPDPLGGAMVEGAVLDPSLVDGGLTTLAAIPTRHGMTLGEQARLYNEILGIHADLTVVPMSGWKRSMLWSDAGLPWFPSSPALVTPDQVQLYGAFGALETLNISVGRGIDNHLAFHVYGAPWIQAAQEKALVSALQKLGLGGITFSSVEWTPDRGVFTGELCRGFRMDVTNAASLRGFDSFIRVSETMRKVLGSQIDFSKSTISLGATWLRDGLVNELPASDLESRALQDLDSFTRERQNALLY